MRHLINNEYFEWLYNLVCERRYSSNISYGKLLAQLHRTEFRYVLPRDRNRLEDGISLRHRYALTKDEAAYDTIMSALCGPCSVLEMMVGLVSKCEEVLDDPSVGDRTGQWFWSMIVNLGLGSMTDDRYNERLVDDAIARLLDREYEPDGRGGLFTIKDCDVDLRTVEIWHQLWWYIDTII